jgi:lysophospholipase L1-like esterase
VPVHSRSHRRLARLPQLLAAVALLAALAATSPASATPTNRASHLRWVGVWSTSPQPPSAVLDGISARGFADQTLRLIVRPHASGDWLRLRLSNTFGDRPVTFGRVEVGRRQSGAALVPGSNHPVTFGGQRSVAIPLGAKARSDPVPLQVKAEHDLAVSLFVPGPTGPATWHWDARQTNYISTAGDHTRDAGAAAFATPVTSWFFLDGLDVRASTTRGAVVTLGESTTDGANSTIDANHRWTDFLARRLQRLPPARQESVLNQGVSGNRILHNSPCFGVGALARLDRDVLAQTGGAKRQALNHWIRTSDAFDGVIDFDRALRDPADPLMLLPTYDSGDHMHPNDAGYQAMANAVALHLLQPSQSPAAAS